MADPWDPDMRGTEGDGAPDAYETGEPLSEGTRRDLRVPIIVLLLVAAVAAAAYFAFFRRASAPASVEIASTPVDSAASKPLGAPADAIDLPRLDETDPIVRRLLTELSSHPQIAAWLATDGLIRNFTTVVLNVAEGKTPAALVRVLRPATPFAVRQSGEDLEIDPASYRRYDALADAFASVDAAGAARLYTMLKPRIADGYRELGYPDAPFDAALERAIVSLLRVPVLDGPVRVAPKGIVYRYEDDALEELTAAQKQLLRMGPRNVRLIQEKLRAVARELGVGEEKLEGRS
jgi:hypothetical protein